MPHLYRISRGHTLALVLLLCSMGDADAEAPPPEPPPAGESDEPPDPATPIIALAREGRQLCKEKKFDEGLKKLAEAVAQGQRAKLSDEQRADLHYTYGLALLRARRAEDGVKQLQQATALLPKDATMRADLAQAHANNDEYDEAIADAKAALALGLEPEDQKDARQVIEDAQRDRLHERLSIEASVGVGFDSNVLQGILPVETIAGRLPGLRRTTTTAGQRRLAVDEASLARAFQTGSSPQPSLADAFNLPLNLNLAVEGRPVGNKRVGLWVGYRFSQVFMLLPKTDDLHDPYNLQEHAVSLRLLAQPVRWFRLVLRQDGFFNLAGLHDFSPYLAGPTTLLDLTFKESARWSTRLRIQNQYRLAVDRSSSQSLDGNRTDVGVTQALQLSAMQLKLGYQFHYDKAGVLDSQVENEVPAGSPVVPGIVYRTAFTYLGNELNLRAFFSLPKNIDLLVGGRYEYRYYPSAYLACFYLNLRDDSTCQESLMQYVDSQQRRDHYLTADATVSFNLPRGFSLDLAYAFTANVSTIKNLVDNRNYTKHTATVAASWSF